MRERLSGFLALCLIALLIAGANASAEVDRISDRRSVGGFPPGFVPAVARNATGRYFVRVDAPSVVDEVSSSRAAGLQEDALQAARRLGGRIAYRYTRVVNGFSAEMSARAAAALAERDDVRAVSPVPVIRPALESSVPFIGAPEVWGDLGVKGKGMTIAVIDSGIDYTHADFGGPGTPAAYDGNDPTVVEPGSFPTSKVIAGHDFVGENFDVADDDPSNDIPAPDPDPLDLDGHGTHVSGICCGAGVAGKVGAGVAPRAEIIALKVFGGESTPGDVIAAAIERAMDPNRDGDVDDHADVISMSLGSDFGSLSSVDALAAQGAVRLGASVVAAAGNAGNQTSAGFAFITGTPGTAPGAISVAASIDEFKSLTLAVNSPPTGALPDRGLAVGQGWSA
ncbi:MAG: S8 family serine peptidase, partial [Actinomycetota bacterium]